MMLELVSALARADLTNALLKSALLANEDRRKERVKALNELFEQKCLPWFAVDGGSCPEEGQTAGIFIGYEFWTRLRKRNLKEPSQTWATYVRDDKERVLWGSIVIRPLYEATRQ